MAVFQKCLTKMMIYRSDTPKTNKLSLLIKWQHIGENKMATLYDLGEDLNLIVERIQDLLNDGIDSNDERVQELLEKMVSQEDEWESKAVNVGKFLNQLALDEKQIDAEIERLTKKKKSISSTHSGLHGLLLFQMKSFGKTEIKNPLLNIKIQQNPISVVVKDEAKIPSIYKTEKTTVTVNKNALKLAHKEGAEIEGVDFIRTEKLSIK